METIRGYSRPASLGGVGESDADVLTLRWFGTTNFELEFRDRVVLLDNFYDRGPRTSEVGFRADEVSRADVILIGHPHYDHISDTAVVSSKTGARVLVHGLGADLLVEQGLDSGNIESVAGLGNGEVFDFDGFSVTVLHGIHMQPDVPGGPSMKELRALWESDLPPLTPDEEAELAEIMARGSWAPEVFTQGTLCYVIDIAGYRVVFRDSAGPISEEEHRYFSTDARCDLALVSYAGRRVARRQVAELTLPLIDRYQPRVAVPCHHDDLFPHFLNMPTEPLRMAVESALPSTDLLQPVYIEPIRIHMPTGSRVHHPG